MFCFFKAIKNLTWSQTYDQTIKRSNTSWLGNHKKQCIEALKKAKTEEAAYDPDILLINQYKLPWYQGAELYSYLFF